MRAKGPAWARARGLSKASPSAEDAPHREGRLVEARGLAPRRATGLGHLADRAEPRREPPHEVHPPVGDLRGQRAGPRAERRQVQRDGVLDVDETGLGVEEPDLPPLAFEVALHGLAGQETAHDPHVLAQIAEPHGAQAHRVARGEAGARRRSRCGPGRACSGWPGRWRSPGRCGSRARARRCPGGCARCGRPPPPWRRRDPRTGAACPRTRRARNPAPRPAAPPATRRRPRSRRCRSPWSGLLGRGAREIARRREGRGARWPRARRGRSRARPRRRRRGRGG